jgi:hypothetical protein
LRTFPFPFPVQSSLLLCTPDTPENYVTTTTTTNNTTTTTITTTTTTTTTTTRRPHLLAA